ncbi:MAG: lysophospholipid acyltransferase family protein [Proteobacteria bacterium]|nr:lysophospholipid acyltransferase family protein [Pseudomonadota bacterium]
MKQHIQRFKGTVRVVNAMRLYHQHTVHGMAAVPESGGVLVVVNHSLATYDILLLAAAIYTETGRLARPLLDRLFFKVPLVREITSGYGAVNGSPANAQALLEAGEIVTVAPGGMRESLRPRSERYQIQWDGRLGFVRIAMKSGVPIILAACPKADELYDVYPSFTTKWFYRTFKVPVFFARGLGLTALPRPIALTHHLSELLHPPAWTGDPETDEANVQAFHAMLVKRMEHLMTLH